MKGLAILAAGLLAFLPFSGRADRLDAMSGQLDRLEPMFWRALAMKSTTQYHRETDQLLSETIASAREIQVIASRAGSSQPNLTVEMNKIRTIFEEVEPFAAENYRFNFKYTSMRDYERQFYREQPELRKKHEKPTLENVPLGDYENWLTDIVRDNTAKVRRSGGDSGSGAGARTDELMKSRVANFFQAVAKMRLTLAGYRQKGKLDFK